MSEEGDFIDGDEFDGGVAEERKIAAQQLTEASEKATALLRRRAEAYRRVFGGLDELGDKKLVLDDLFNFCKFGDTPFHTDERIHVLLTGRYEVARRVADHMQLTYDELLLKYSKLTETR